LSLRTKLLLALIPLAGALLLLGGQALRVISEQGMLSQRILKDNYRSVLAAQRMKDSIERIDSAMTFRALGQLEKAAAQEAQNRKLFNTELDVQQHNITEAGEAEVTLALQKKWSAYLAAADSFAALPAEQQRSEYFALMEPAFYGVKSAAERILELNQDAMVRKSEQVRVAAGRQNGLMLAATLAAALSGVLASVWITSQLLRPLSVLSQAVRRVAEGDLDARATLPGDDEIAQLGKELNAMAARLGEYRRSSLGELLQAQHASQAAIDSLPDPVVILGNDSALLNVNRAAESLLQLDASVRVEPLSRAVPAIRQLLEKLRLHVTGGKGAYAPKGFDEALRLDAADGAHYLLPRAEPVYSEDSGIVGTAIIL
jgi:NtrC-family two-component system sensor histidine kinase KinB